jgi:hypothetical protein
VEDFGSFNFLGGPQHDAEQVRKQVMDPRCVDSRQLMGSKDVLNLNRHWEM